MSPESLLPAQHETRRDSWTTFSTSARHQAILDTFLADIAQQFCAADFERGVYLSEDRAGHPVFNPVVTVSLGAIKVESGHFCSHHQIATAAAAGEAHFGQQPVHRSPNGAMCTVLAAG